MAPRIGTSFVGKRHLLIYRFSVAFDIFLNTSDLSRRCLSDLTGWLCEIFNPRQQFWTAGASTIAGSHKGERAVRASIHPTFGTTFQKACDQTNSRIIFSIAMCKRENFEHDSFGISASKVFFGVVDSDT